MRSSSEAYLLARHQHRLPFAHLPLQCFVALLQFGTFMFEQRFALLVLHLFEFSVKRRIENVNYFAPDFLSRRKTHLTVESQFARNSSSCFMCFVSKRCCSCMYRFFSCSWNCGRRRFKCQALRLCFTNYLLDLFFFSLGIVVNGDPQRLAEHHVSSFTLSTNSLWQGTLFDGLALNEFFFLPLQHSVERRGGCKKKLLKGLSNGLTF